MTDTPKAPLTIIRGGTTSTSQDRANEALVADLAERQRVSDLERRAASIPVQEGGGVLNEVDLGKPNTHGVVMMQYDLGSGMVSYMQCDLNVLETGDGKPVLNLVMLCPRCLERGFPVDEATMNIRQDNRKWFLDERKKGELFVTELGEVYTIAGTVTCDETSVCPRPSCGWRFKIAPDGQRPGTSRMVKVGG